MPRKRSSKVTAEVTLPDDLLSDPITTPAPVVDGAEKQGSNDAVTVNAVTDNAAQSVKESATTTAADVAGGSGLSVEEKFQDNQAPIAVLDEFLEDDEDEELEIDIAKEDAFRLRYTAILLIPMHTENASYLKEKATRPLAIEVVFRRVPANIVPDVLKDLLVRFKLKKRQQSAFKEGFGFHRVAHPLTGADTDVIKGLTYLSHLSLTISVALAAASLRTSALVTPILKDPSIALVSTGSNREEWICTQVCCGKAKGKTFLAAADHIISSTHLLNQEKMGTATKASMDKAALAAALGRPGIRKAVEAALAKAAEDGDGNFELLLGRLNAGLRAYMKEEKKRVKKTTAHLAEVVAELHQEQMRNPSCQKTSDLFHVRDAQLREYHASKRDRLHVMTGTDSELAGEVPSPFLSARVKVRKQKTQIAELKVGGVKISDSPGILTAATQYFTDLFGTDGRTSAERWKPLAGRKLDAESAAGLAADWTEEEVKQAFKALADGKSPGKDGLPKELFERHWDVLGKEFLRMAQSFSVSATIPASIKEAITILLHKKGEKDNLDNYRPITLLNFTYKVLARVVANRMKMHLHKVISAEQYGFIPARRISEAIGVVADVIEAAKKGNEDWYMLLVDFRKAFDSVSRSFLFSILKEMGFPERFVGWVEGLHKDTRTRLLINSWLGEAVDVKSRVRQGCPLAPYLFLCAVEPLAQEAERRKIGLCNKANQRLAYVGYADDTTLFLDGKRQIARAEKLLAWFAGLSGLQTNKGKSVILPIGHNIGRRPGTLGGFKWAKADEAERVLGVWVTPSGSSEPTWKRAFEKIIVELIKWKALFLTIAARVVIINCYITPRIAYQAQVYPPSEEIWKKLVKLIHNFLTGNNASAEKGFVLWNWGLLTTPKADGGLGVLDPGVLLACLAARRIGCLLLEKNKKKKEITLKAAGLPLGEDTFLAHERLLKHWPGENERWLQTCETFMKSPMADTGKSDSKEEVAQERVVFNRKLLLNCTNPVGGQKEAKGLWGTRLGDLVTTRQDGTVEIKDMDTLERELRSRDSARLALKALDAAPQEWKEVLIPDASRKGAGSGVKKSSGNSGGGEHAAATIFRSGIFTNGQLSSLKQLRESWAVPDAVSTKQEKWVGKWSGKIDWDQIIHT
ncbi:unnamed protein product [Closterium sp. NIES-65]|nr:unnamed protein product [Closterium sp. NIES-65]